MVGGIRHYVRACPLCADRACRRPNREETSRITFRILIEVSALVFCLVLKYVIKPVPSLFLLFPVVVVPAAAVVARSVQFVQLGVVAMAAVTSSAAASSTASLQTYTSNAIAPKKRNQYRIVRIIIDLTASVY